MFTIENTNVYLAYITLYDKMDLSTTAATYTYQLVKEGVTETVEITNVTNYSTYTELEIDPVASNLTPGEYELQVIETIDTVSNIIYKDRVDVIVGAQNTQYAPSITKKQYNPNNL